MQTFSIRTLKKHCDQLRKSNALIARLHHTYGYPPYWKRPNNFESLCKTIIEQQVSLASAKSSFNRLKLYCKKIEPNIIASIDEDNFRSNGITKQKACYLKLLAERLIEEPHFFEFLESASNEMAKEKLMELKGIGNWTSNVFMLVALNRINVYPDFDVALINSIAYEEFGGAKVTNEIAKEFISQFDPIQSIAVCYYYHAYICRKKIEFIP